MHVEVDGAAITTAAIRLAEQAGLLRHHLATCARIPDGLLDRNLRAGATALADLTCDALEVLALDLELLSTKVSGGAALYDVTERAVANAMAGRGRG